MKKNDPYRGLELQGGKPRETTAYLLCKKYQDDFLYANEIVDALKERRRFYDGEHYLKGYAVNTPKPTNNICREGVDKINAKLNGTKRSVTFLADKEDEDLASLDDFYEFQQKEMKRQIGVVDATRVGLVDGNATVFTAFDKDALGTQGIYKGFLEDTLVPFERTFWSNPHSDDPQKMEWLGYYLDMEVGSARAMVEGKSDAEIENKKKFVAQESLFYKEPPYDFESASNSAIVRVYVRFFRVDGEVYFECSTRYVNLFAKPHAINPRLNRKIDTELGDEDGTMENPDYPIDEAKHTLFEKAERETYENWVAKKGKFSRYPVSVYIPYPDLPNRCIIGNSLVQMVIPNQKIINYLNLLAVLIHQYFAMPKWLVKPEALKDQEPDNSVNQVLVDYSRIQENGGSWGITRLSGGDPVSNSLMAMAQAIEADTRSIYGFANLEASGVNVESGYEYEQRVHQINLPLEIPQMRLWEFVADLARTDILYYKHYIDEAKFIRVRSDAEIGLNERYREMEQGLIDAGKSELPRGHKLPRTRRFEIGEIKQGFFDDEFCVAVEVEQGIAGSQLSESQHFNQIWSYVAQGNLTADKIKMLVEGDPAISRKTRANIKASLEQLETSQLAMKDQEIAALKQAVSELQSYMKFSQQVVKQQQLKQKAIQQAAAEQGRVAAKLLSENASVSAPMGMSESEVKSMNAKGISGGSFSKGGNQTAHNTGI